MPRLRLNPISRRRPQLGILRGLGAAVQSLSVGQLVLAAAQQYGVDPELAMAVARQESGLNPNARNPSTGASGVMQLMPATAASLGVTNILDPQQNVYAGVRYLGMMLDQFEGDTAKALAAYNWGPGNVQNAVAAYGAAWLSAAPTETQNYVQAITGISPSSTTGGGPVTIDASTGQVVDDTTDVTALPTIDSSGLITLPPTGSGLDLNSVVLVGSMLVGVWLLVDILDL